MTGHKAIFLHPDMVERLDGKAPEESRDYLERLLEQTIVPEVTYRHQWLPGDLVLMDNRSQMHVAYTDYDFTEGRTLYRVLVRGDTPY